MRSTHTNWADIDFEDENNDTEGLIAYDENGQSSTIYPREYTFLPHLPRGTPKVLAVPLSPLVYPHFFNLSPPQIDSLQATR